MSRDMRKVPLGTHWTRLGSPFSNSDKTPAWLVLVFSIIAVMAIGIFVRDYSSKGVISVFHLEIFLFIVGIYSFLRAVFNWKNLLTRYYELVMSSVFIGSGFGLMFKP